MKKLWILFIVLSLILCSCGNTTGEDPNTDESNPLENEEQTDPPEATTYEDIERRKATSYKANYYGFKEDGALIKLALPTEWTVCKVEEGFDISRDGELVGRLIGSSANDVSLFTVLKTESRFVGDVCVTKYIEEKNGCKDYRYRYVYGYTTNGCARTVTLTAACAEIDERTEKKLYTDVTMHEKRVSNTVGMLSSLENPSSILILGNSFINSSDIGLILSEMLQNNEKNCEVTAISRAYATVETYVSDEQLLDSIRAGTYDAVFICGFYSKAQIDHLGVLKEACDASAAQLIIFPAHNEGGSIVESAKTQHPSLLCLNWKAEINGLISNGVDRWDLCENDTHNHSKPLAGYVGAHMIYRAIYDELPSEPMHRVISQEFIDGILGDYAYKGDLKVIDEDKIRYLN